MTPKRFNLILIGLTILLIAVAGGGYYLAVTKVHAGIGNLKQHLANEQIADDHINQLEQLNKQYQKILPQIPLLDAALPHDKQQSGIAVQLQQIASANGLSLNALSFATTTGLASATSQTVKDSNALALQLSFQSSGSYDQLQNFLVAVEKLNRYSNIATLSINRVQDKPKLVNFTVSMNVYVKP